MLIIDKKEVPVKNKLILTLISLSSLICMSDPMEEDPKVAALMDPGWDVYEGVVAKVDLDDPAIRAILMLENDDESADGTSFSGSANILKNPEMDNRLLVGAFKNNIKTVEDALKGMANVNAINPLGHTSLYLAATNNNPEMVGLLLSYGADIDITTEGQTALDIAKEKKYQGVIDLLEPTLVERLMTVDDEGSDEEGAGAGGA
jgi:hypothetical protein